MHALPTLLPGQWHAGLKAVKTILRRIFIKRDRAWKSYTKVRSCRLGLPLGTDAPSMMPKGVRFSFVVLIYQWQRQGTLCSWILLNL